MESKPDDPQPEEPLPIPPEIYPPSMPILPLPDPLPLYPDQEDIPEIPPEIYPPSMPILPPDPLPLPPPPLPPPLSESPRPRKYTFRRSKPPSLPLPPPPRPPKYPPRPPRKYYYSSPPPPVRIAGETYKRGSETRQRSPMLPDSQPGILTTTTAAEIVHESSSLPAVVNEDPLEVRWGDKRLYSVDGSVDEIFEWQEMGIVIHVPAGVVSPGDLCDITVVPVLTGKFLFPEDVLLVSGIFAISTSCKILKPIRIHLQHCVNLSRGMEEDMTFAKAESSGRSPPYSFEVYDGGIFTTESKYESLYGALECQEFSFIGIFTRIRRWFNVRYNAQLLLNSQKWRAYIAVTKDIVSLLESTSSYFVNCEKIADATFSFAGIEITVETAEESTNRQWEIKPLKKPCKIQRADANAYGPGSERSIPKLSFVLEPKPGCSAKLYHEMQIKGATEPDLSLYLSCSPSTSGILTTTAAAEIVHESSSSPAVVSEGLENQKGQRDIIHEPSPPSPGVNRGEPHVILQRQVSQLSRAISTPDQLATDMWSSGLIGDEFKDMISTKQGLSRSDKADKLLMEMHRCLNNSSKEEELLHTFCSVLEKQGDTALSKIAKEMTH